jgi:hypothetical protein
LRILESPTTSQVRFWLQRVWSPTLIYYAPRGFERLMNKGTSRWLADGELLNHSRLSSISFCGTESLGRLLSVDNVWADQLLLVRGGGTAQRKARPIDGELLTAFGSLIGDLVERGQSERPRVIHLSPEAARFWGKIRGGVLAARLALLFDRCASATGPELDASFLFAAWPIAKRLLHRSAEVGQLVRRRRDRARIQRTMTKMLRVIKQAGTIRRRDLLRGFHEHGQGHHSAALAAVLTSGRVCQHREKRSTWLSYHET